MCLAIPGRVLEIFEDRGLRMGRADFGGTVRKVCLEHLPEAGIGDYVLVHVGFALSKVDPEEAERTYRFLEDLDQLAEIRRVTTRPWTLMEVCGGQTHSIVKHGIDRLLPAELELVHGPACPVCVTPLEQIDKAHAIARTPGVIFTSFGDMLRVPGSQTDLLRLKSAGADVR